MLPWFRAAATLAAVLAAGCQSRDRVGPLEPRAPLTSVRASEGESEGESEGAKVQHVLLLSIDGMHASDLARFIQAHPKSTLARLSRRGTTFANASASKPSDSFPGLLAQVTGATPRTTGVYYDDSYDRRLSAPGSNCSTVGTEVVYDESIDKNSNVFDGGGGIDPAALPRDPAHGCTPVYPHQFLRANTIFEVAKGAHLRTAWSDKHLSYEIVNGPSGHGVDDLFTPEIAYLGPTGHPEDNAANAAAYDDIKVTAILNEIAGHDHTGAGSFGAPAIFGMNFQAVSVGQKTAGYLDAAGTPSSALAGALSHTDASIGSMVAALKAHHLLDKTLIIVSAKHGQSPVDPSLRRIVNKNLIPNAIDAISPGLVAQATEDDIALIWLTDQSKTQQAADALNAQKASLFIDFVLSDGPLAAMFDNPLTDSRTPDIIAQPLRGVIYTSPTATKLAEHGGFLHDDINVPILVSGGGVAHTLDVSPVTTTQIAPTILRALGLNPAALIGVQREGTKPLPLKVKARDNENENENEQ
jgi:hypothetical protein